MASRSEMIYPYGSGSPARIEKGMLPLRLIPSEEEFEALWNSHPEARGKIKQPYTGKVIDVPRWQETFGEEYTFSRMKHEPTRDLPENFLPFLEWINSLGLGEFNQTLVNWYANGLDYIGPHSDDETQLVPNSPIVSITLAEEGSARVFRIRDKGKYPGKKILDIMLENGMVLIMYLNELYRHEVPKITGKKGKEKIGRRINVTFRQF